MLKAIKKKRLLQAKVDRKQRIRHLPLLLLPLFLFLLLLLLKMSDDRDRKIWIEEETKKEKATFSSCLGSLLFSLCLVAVWFYYYYYSMPRTIFSAFNTHTEIFTCIFLFFVWFSDSVIFFSFFLFCLTLEFYWCLLHRSLSFFFCECEIMKG